MYIATNSDAADAFRVKRRSAVMSTPLSVRLRWWLTEAWTERKQRRIARLVSSAAAATAAELPTFEIIGFPLTQHQLTVLNTGIVQERPPARGLTLASMPASPVQIGVLTPRSKLEFAAKDGSPAHN